MADAGQFVIKGEEYNMIKNFVLVFLESQQEKRKKVTQRQVVEEFINFKMEDLEESTYQEWIDKINHTIEFLINKEGMVIVENADDDKQARELALSIAYEGIQSI